ncbi:MAG TPA: 3-hydroxyacyl-CoA dehydrogenase NAD-binding domain-containing protein, partial [Geminicoccaceae bacterium]|nr:3-hydroxyacyl-CoA dehydrogenase NAD-binding domain-containing protein [Geminicoccaceae bacterium]
MAIQRVAVIGSGVMGGGIAAHVANAGVPVLLLDVVPEGAVDNRNALAEGAVRRLLKSDPAAFMHERAARLVTPGNLEDDLGRLAGCDWIVEAVVEDPGVKRRLYERIDAARRPGSIVSSNTSTLQLAKLIEGLPARFRRDFLITHFFNPPRYLRLLEVVAGDETRPEAVEAVSAFADHALGKTVVRAKDTPGFIANRIGGFWMECALTEALERGIAVEAADAVLGRPLGIPKTGVFGLMDLVGIDLLPRVARSLAANLSPGDAFHGVHREHGLVRRMIADGYTGRKGKGGFYRLNRANGQRVKEALDLRTGAYRPAEEPRLGGVEAAAQGGGPRALFESADAASHYAWSVMSRTLAYAASLVPEVADDIVAVDEAMRLGYNWERGPFELIDRLGPAWFADRLRRDGLPVPPLLERVGEGAFYRVEDGRLRYLTTDGAYVDVPRRPGVLLLADIKL